MLGLLFAAGCDFVFSLHGRVRSSAGPLAQARVSIICPTSDEVRIMTDEAGRVHHEHLHPADGACRVKVEKEGFESREFLLSEICTRRFGEGCLSAVLEADLGAERPGLR